VNQLDPATALLLNPIGVIHTPFNEPTGTPIQSGFAGRAAGRVEVFEPYVAGLTDLEGFERIWLLYWFHRAREPRLKVVPYRDTVERGVFATRAPCRPCPLGLSAVRLIEVSGNILHIEGADMLDGTPLLDIKPYVPRFDCVPSSAAGWLDRTPVDREQADDRFA